MSEAVLLQLIATTGVVLGALLLFFGTVLTVLSNRTRQHARAASNNTAETRDEVKNDHKTNLRDDLDAKFAEVLAELAGVKSTQATQGRQINHLFRNDRELHEELEQTQTKAAPAASKPRSYKPKEKM
jgi:hypothetical protein